MRILAKKIRIRAQLSPGIKIGIQRRSRVTWDRVHKGEGELGTPQLGEVSQSYLVPTRDSKALGSRI